MCTPGEEMAKGERELGKQRCPGRQGVGWALPGNLAPKRALLGAKGCVCVCLALVEDGCDGQL